MTEPSIDPGDPVSADLDPVVPPIEPEPALLPVFPPTEPLILEPDDPEAEPEPEPPVIAPVEPPSRPAEPVHAPHPHPPHPEHPSHPLGKTKSKGKGHPRDERPPSKTLPDTVIETRRRTNEH